MAETLTKPKFMDITELLQFVDRLVSQQTGEHLDDLQKSIIQGLLTGKTYKDIAEDIGNDGYNENYIGDVSRKLFKILSQQLNEDIKKSNFCWTLERAINSQIFGFNNNNVTLCPYYPNGNSEQEEQAIATPQPPPPQKICHDLTMAPKIWKFGDRTDEIDTLSRWLIDESIPLISVVGIAGIGKTTLVKKLVDRHKDNFEVVSWKNLKLSPHLTPIANDILTKFNKESSPKDYQIHDLINLLIQQKCLLILDDLQELFISGKLAGQYQKPYKNYSQFLRTIAQIEHKSSIIVISQEQSQEMLLSLNNDLYPIKSLTLSGLNSVDILESLQLSDRESWSNLIEIYEGHPVYLEDICYLIRNMFCGKVSEFLAEDTPVITELMSSQLGEVFERLSSMEKAIALQLSQVDRPLSRSQLTEKLSLSSTEIIKGLQSLQRRCLLKTMENGTMMFRLSPVFKQYIWKGSMRGLPEI
ncbi:MULTISPECIES: NB-ARC domain-containing protein [Limnospira]|uniref:NB-ARC domain-containing protein n=1 Tax=Limnospira TaxID=2596745 RepID=UPI000DC525A4|nr:NB-ARC domain-containing protein [Limnospira sp. PMC 917.15]MDT9233078.1 NB-ARC domain-containing protein [Limnospira sp. PMC 917.15]QJB24775.1 AAA family ATPase [Limnospira fusiformis SAG 85.79]RAQ45923.1 ATPase domain-containing protein [Arthrospira sp. O9.13F]